MGSETDSLDALLAEEDAAWMDRQAAVLERTALANLAPMHRRAAAALRACSAAEEGRRAQAHEAILRRLEGPLPVGAEHTIAARMQTTSIARHLCLFIERAMHGEAVTLAEVEQAQAAVAAVGHRATWEEREHPLPDFADEDDHGDHVDRP